MFQQTDPLDTLTPSGINSYQYANGNPIVWTDPRGLKSVGLPKPIEVDPGDPIEVAPVGPQPGESAPEIDFLIPVIVSWVLKSPEEKANLIWRDQIERNPLFEQIVVGNPRYVQRRSRKADCSDMPPTSDQELSWASHFLSSNLAGNAATSGVMVFCIDHQFGSSIAANGCSSEGMSNDNLVGLGMEIQKQLWSNQCHAENNLLSTLALWTSSGSKGWLRMVVSNLGGYICGYCMYNVLPVWGARRPGIRTTVRAVDTQLYDDGLLPYYRAEDSFTSFGGDCETRKKTGKKNNINKFACITGIKGKPRISLSNKIYSLWG